MIAESDRDALIQSWLDALRHLARQRASATVGSTTDPWGEVTARTLQHVRVFMVRDDHTTVVGCPEQENDFASLTAGSEVELIVGEGQHRMLAHCPVLGHLTVPRQDGTRIAALHLALPLQVYTAERLEKLQLIVSGPYRQRRRHFRVDASRFALPPALLAPVERLDGEAPRLCAKQAKVMGASIMNLSAGGVGLGLDANQDLPLELRWGERYACQLELPGLSEPLVVAAKLLHRQPPEGHPLYLGFQFACRGQVERGRLEDQLLRITTQMERALLQHQRKAKAKAQAQAS